MDSEQFDRVTKALAHAGPRRRMVRLLAALPLGVILTSRFGGAPDATAEDDDHGSSHRRHRRRARHRHRRGREKERNKNKGPHKSNGKGKGKPRKPECTPTTCAAQAKNCGTIADGCGNPLRCGPDSCGDGYSCTDNRCLCADGTAVCEGVCCAAGQVCHNGDGPCCTPVDPCGSTSCGSVTDNCGGVVECGDCESPETCGGGNPGTPNVCGCTNSTCPAEARCGFITNLCDGQPIGCGTCPFAGQPCANNVCGTCVPNCAGRACGVGDDCGGLCSGPCSPSCPAGTCSGDLECRAGTCAVPMRTFICDCRDATIVSCVQHACPLVAPQDAGIATGEVCPGVCATHGGWPVAPELGAGSGACFVGETCTP